MARAGEAWQSRRVTRVGAVFSPYPNPPEALPQAAVRAERAGLDELWLWEDCFRSSAFAAASAALAVTSTLRVGIGIAPMPLRNVAATAMEIATLARMFPGRPLPGLGHGVQSWMAQAGARVASPLTLMREYIPAVRALLAGEEVTVTGRHVTLDAVRLDWPPARVPRVYAAAEGPKTLRLSGEVADGTVLDSGHTIEEVAHAAAEARAGREDAGRDGGHEVVAYVKTGFAPDAVARFAAEWSGAAPHDVARRVLGGTVGEVTDGVRRLAAVGVDRVVLVPPTSEHDLTVFLDHAGEVARRVE